VDLQAGAELADVLVESRLEPARPQPAAGEPRRRDRGHAREQRVGVEVGRAEQLERMGRAAALGQRRAFEHDRAGKRARHRQGGGVRARVHPGALAERPAPARCGGRRPSLHGDHLAFERELAAADEPPGELAEREAVADRQRAGADEALPAGAQEGAFDRAADRVGPVEHPDRLAARRGFLEDVPQRRHEGVDARADVLQVDEQQVEGVHHRRGRPPHGAIEAAHGDAEARVGEVRRLDHVVLLVAAHAVLRTEGGREAQVAARRQRVERVREIGGHRGRMGEQRHTAAGERRAQRGIGEQAIESGLHRRDG
jgi:hypothetical protein